MTRVSPGRRRTSGESSKFDQRNHLPRFCYRLRYHSYSTLCDRATGGTTRRQAHGWQQALPASVGRALDQWAIGMDACGFLPRLDLFMWLASHLAQKHADKEGDPSFAELGQNWLRGFLNRHLNFRLASRPTSASNECSLATLRSYPHTLRSSSLSDANTSSCLTTCTT